MSRSAEAPVETILRDELAHDDVVLGTVGPILGHLLANHDHSLFSDEIVSRVRGMISDVARQLLEAQAEAAGDVDPRRRADEKRTDLARHLVAVPSLAAHCHALALESQLTSRLERRSGIDPVLPPLLQALVASDDAATASTAMAALAAQARFIQYQRRMELPLGELPADIFAAILADWSETSGDSVSAQLRDRYDESTSRLGLLGRLVTGMGAGHRAALSVSHGGVALFLSALAATNSHDRDLTVLSTNDHQLARLALSLRAAGLKPREIEEQFLVLHPESELPVGFEDLRGDRAAEMLAASGRTSAP